MSYDNTPGYMERILSHCFLFVFKGGLIQQNVGVRAPEWSGWCSLRVSAANPLRKLLGSKKCGWRRRRPRDGPSRARFGRSEDGQESIHVVPLDRDVQRPPHGRGACPPDGRKLFGAPAVVNDRVLAMLVKRQRDMGCLANC